jgi:hypothetical protein
MKEEGKGWKGDAGRAKGEGGRAKDGRTTMRARRGGDRAKAI